MNLQRIEQTAPRLTIAITVAIAIIMAINALLNPMRARQQELDAKLAVVTPTELSFNQTQASLDQWQLAIAGKPALWNPLIAPLPAPSAPPGPGPNIEKMLEGITVSRQQVGSKVKIISPSNPRGSFVAVGEQVNGATIKEISRTTVTFSVNWNGQEITHAVPRQ